MTPRLPIHDVSAGRREQLRARCHAALARQARETSDAPPAWARILGPAAAAAWGLAYLLQTLRLALAYISS